MYQIYLKLLDSINLLTSKILDRYQVLIYTLDESVINDDGFSEDYYQITIVVRDAPHFLKEIFTNKSLAKEFMSLNDRITQLCNKIARGRAKIRVNSLKSDEMYEHGYDDIENAFNLMRINLK